MVSIIWTFFERLTDKVKCKICGHELFYRTGASTSNMIRHMKTKHPFDFEKEKEKDKRPAKRNFSASNAQTKETSDEASIIVSSTRGATCETQITLAGASAHSFVMPDKKI